MNPTLINALTVLALFGGTMAIVTMLYALLALGRLWRGWRVRRWRGARRL